MFDLDNISQVLPMTKRCVVIKPIKTIDIMNMTFQRVSTVVNLRKVCFTPWTLTAALTLPTKKTSVFHRRNST